MKNVFIVFAILCTLIMGVFPNKAKERNKSMGDTVQDGSGMEYEASIKEITYYSTPDEYGRSKSYSLKADELEYRYNGGTVEESAKLASNVGIDLYNSLDEIVNKYNMKNWSMLEKNDIQVLDDGTVSFTIEFDDGTVIKLGDEYIMPEDGWKAIREIIDLFGSYLK